VTNQKPVRPSTTIAAFGQEDLVGLTEKLHEQKKRLKDTEIMIEEADIPKVPSKVYSPTPEEYNRHCATHLPYRSWCPICVQAKKRNPAHRHTTTGIDNKKHIPVISVDYMYMNDNIEDKNNPILVVHDGESEGVWAIFARKKGESSYVKHRLANIIRRLGYAKVIIKSDQEPAIKNMENQVIESLLEDDFKEQCGCQVTVQHSPVGESAANGAIENTIQRVQGQVRALKLDLEANLKRKLAPTQTIWPWLVEYAAQTLLYWRISGEDGLTAIQRIRGRSTTAPRPRFGEKVMYKIPKTVKINKSEARWKYGIWLGSIESSDEHLIGTKLGVIKARAVTALPDDKRFDVKDIDEMQGLPWKPSTRHRGMKIRTNINDNDDEDEEDEQDDEPEAVQLEVYDDEDPTETAEDIVKKQDVIMNRTGQSYSFTIKARDVLKYGPHPGCPGCKFVTGEVTTQSGHNKECKSRIMVEMEKDKEDKHRVRRWYVAKGIEESDDTTKTNKADHDMSAGTSGPTTTNEADDVQMTGANQPAAAASSSSSSTTTQQAQSSDKRDRDDGGSSSKKAKVDSMRWEELVKRLKVKCLNLCDKGITHENDVDEVFDNYIKNDPIFTVTSTKQPEDIRHEIREQQHHHMKYFIDVDGRCITTNSAMTLSMLKLKGTIKEIKRDGEYFQAVVADDAKQYDVDTAVNQGMKMQTEIDMQQLFVCEVNGNDVNDESVQEALESSERCHEPDPDTSTTTMKDDEFKIDEVAWDDVNNCPLDPVKVREARRAEMDYFRKMKVYKKVPLQRCKDLTGKAPIKVRWIDTNKQDEQNPKYRSRLVAKDFKKYHDPDLYTATPPIEMLRYIISRAATGMSRTGRRRKLMVNDVARAYFNAPNLTPLFVEICEEDREPGDEYMCGELLVSMYGTRPAASNWQKCYTELLQMNGFKVTRASTCMLWHPEKDIVVMVHGDDFISTADGDDLEWLKMVFETKFEISTEVIGHEHGDLKELKVLNRFISATEDGFVYESDVRHADILIKELGLENAKKVNTPVADVHHESDELLDHDKFKKYQSLCARANFMAIDRFDLQYAAKECCKAMSRPTMRDWAKLKRIGRYVIGRRRLVYRYVFQDELAAAVVYSDANWASDASDRRSTSGGVIVLGLHYIRSWSKTQSLVALSSAESELYAIVKASSEVLGFQSTIRDLGHKIGTIILSDASAALGIIQRQGLGRMRHIDCSFLFVQSLNANKVVQFAKVPGYENPADLCTKGLAEEAILRHVGKVGGQHSDGRPNMCPQVLEVLNRTRCKDNGSEGGCENKACTQHLCVLLGEHGLHTA
jgi:hypothetical protein